MTALRALIFGALMVSMLLSSLPSAAAVSPEDRVKAAYLYKFAAFVRWPEAASGGSEFRICVAGGREVTLVLRQLVQNERVMGRRVEVVELGAGDAARVSACEVLYLAREPQTARLLLDAAEGRPILTVADRSGGTSGGVIDLAMRDGKVRFTISRNLARQQQLDLSSKLLDTAVAVRP